MRRKSRKTVDIIIPVFNEGEVVLEFHNRIRDAIEKLSYDFKIHFINDGSTDDTGDYIRQIQQTDSTVHVLEFTRNFGHQAALTAGIDHSNADILITIDGDGEQPPSLIPDMLNLYEQGYEVVLTQRVPDPNQFWFKRWTSRLFYRFMNWISETQLQPGSADFRLITRSVVEAMKSMKEYHRFLRGMIAWSGYRYVILPYKEEPRIGKKTKYTLGRMLKFAMDGIFSFSLVPLRLGILVGSLFFVVAFVEVIYVLSFWLRGKENLLIPGWSSLMFMILIVSGTILILLGILGLYIGYIFQEVKGRPVYFIKVARSEDHLSDTVIELDS